MASGNDVPQGDVDDTLSLQDPNAFPVPTFQDLAGFWDLLQLSIEDVSMKFAELLQLKANGWKIVEPKVRAGLCCRHSSLITSPYLHLLLKHICTQSTTALLGCCRGLLLANTWKIELENTRVKKGQFPCHGLAGRFWAALPA